MEQAKRLELVASLLEVVVYHLQAIEEEAHAAQIAAHGPAKSLCREEAAPESGAKKADESAPQPTEAQPYPLPPSEAIATPAHDSLRDGDAGGRLRVKGGA